MNLNIAKGVPFMLSALLLTGCVDNDYDLSNVDKTTEIKIKDLVLPVNLDAVLLDDIIDLDDESKIKTVTINGKEIYAVSETGTFSSDPIDISGFTADSPVVSPSTTVFRTAGTQQHATASTLYRLDSSTPQDINISATDIDESIYSITLIETAPMMVRISMEATGIGSSTTMKFSSLTMNFIKGLTFESLPANYSYDATSGELTVTDLDCPDHKCSIDLTVTAIDFTKSGTSLKNHCLTFNSRINVKDGSLITETDLSADVAVPSEITFTVNTYVDPMRAKSFTGQIHYSLEGDGLDIDPIDLSDLPDFLAQDGTDLKLQNPQIYLNLTNPVATDRLTFHTGLMLTAVRQDSSIPFMLDNNGTVNVGYGEGFGPYNFVLSPSLPAEPLPEFAQGITHVPFSGLSNVLSGNGLPDRIEISLINPELPVQDVNRFRLNNSLPAVEGKYEFFAPLALKDGENGSVIIYTDTKDGWYDDDLEKLTIEHLAIEADATSTIPLGAKITVHPIDINGNRIPGVTVEGAEIAANASGQHITVSVKGTITNLDGIYLEAVVRPGSGETLAPSQTIRLDNLKARVSGKYVTEP